MLSRAGALLVALSFCAVSPQSCALSGPSGSVARGGEIRTQSLMALLRFPNGYDSTAAYPLLVALHGRGGTATEFVRAFRTFAEDSLVVAVPQGEYGRADGGYSWYYQTEDRSLWEAYDARSVNTVVELVSAISARHRVGKVFVLGFSQGASLAYMIGLKNPSLVSGVLAVSGSMPEIFQGGSIVREQDVAAARGVKLFIARGSRDAFDTREIFAAQVDFFTGNGYEVTALEFAGGHYFTADLVAGIRQWLRERAR